jgi:hypothetical protein
MGHLADPPGRQQQDCRKRCADQFKYRAEEFEHAKRIQDPKH